MRMPRSSADRPVHHGDPVRLAQRDVRTGVIGGDDQSLRLGANVHARENVARRGVDPGDRIAVDAGIARQQRVKHVQSLVVDDIENAAIDLHEESKHDLVRQIERLALAVIAVRIQHGLSTTWISASEAKIMRLPASSMRMKLPFTNRR